MQLYKREEGLTIEASLSEKTISQDDNGLKVDEAIIDLNISGKQDSFWFTYDSKETQNDEVQNTQTYGFATKNVSSSDRTIYSYNKTDKTWNTFNEDDYVDFEGDAVEGVGEARKVLKNIFPGPAVQRYVFHMQIAPSLMQIAPVMCGTRPPAGSG